ncbi:hypothetical protein HN011_008453 [Eciton burchellii]|nr:hypothetical protein HN011_008453 [Eciton burchellii]
MLQQASFYSTLTAEERARTDPCTRARCVMMSSGDTTPQAQASISSTGFDTVDDTRLDKKDQAIVGLTSIKPAKSAEMAVTDPEAIEEVISIRETQFTSKTKPKMENGIDIEKDKEPRQQIEDDCLINCIYYTQECCSCTIS